ncbi:hypothetical protein C1H70_09745 [Halomonas urumqiensis]|uniref:Uncharacterized protein n=1 Tax=Halomonas urumqiensis TaxID=1684789 RepID=A0A2N7UI42_9GAMM|nr:hypothetical protein C1H70_09745 [Halomonas urumqiensis]PTB01273.1 hypothetical protein C6V82_15905 [Halomonas urumqiensis]
MSRDNICPYLGPAERQAPSSNRNTSRKLVNPIPARRTGLPSCVLTRCRKSRRLQIQALDGSQPGLVLNRGCAATMTNDRDDEIPF